MSIFSTDHGKARDFPSGTAIFCYGPCAHTHTHIQCTYATDLQLEQHMCTRAERRTSPLVAEISTRGHSARVISRDRPTVRT